jgi:hypothetical protein
VRLSSKHTFVNSPNILASNRAVEAMDRERAARVTASEDELRRRLALLRTEHRDLDAAISALAEADGQDQLQVARLKKRKLALKDQIAAIEDYLTPDIIA